MKMFKKLMAVALVGVMALSMLTGCAAKNEHDLKNALKVAGQSHNPSVTVEVDGSKKVADKKLSDWADKAATALGKQVNPVGVKTGTISGIDSKVFVYVVKEQNSNEKWRAEAGKAVDALIASAKTENDKYYVYTKGFDAKEKEGKNAKEAEYVVIVAMAK